MKFTTCRVFPDHLITCTAGGSSPSVSTPVSRRAGCEHDARDEDVRSELVGGLLKLDCNFITVIVIDLLTQETKFWDGTPTTVTFWR